jgi:hypothetical protein
MDYSHDVCLYEWTQGQIDVMHASIDFYRRRRAPELTPVQLFEGIASTKYGLANEFGRQFYMDVPSTSVVVYQVLADNGDVDLFMNWDGGLASFRCTSESLSSDETCFIGPDSGRAYLWVYGQITTIDFTVECDTGSVNSVVELTSGTPVTGLDFDAGELQPFILALPTPTDALSFMACTTKGTGDIDLFMSFYESIANAACSSNTPGSALESCEIGPNAGTAYIWLFAAASSMPVSIECTISPFDATKLTSGVVSAQFDLALKENAFFYVDASNPSTVTCVTEAFHGDLDLFVSWNGLFDIDCSSQDSSSFEVCSLRPGTGYLFARAYGYTETFNITIACTLEEVTTIELSDGVSADPFDAALDEYTLFTLLVPSPSFVTCTTAGGDGDLELSMNWDGSSSYECISEDVTAEESYTIGSNSGTAYAYTFGYEPSSGYSITCTIDR